MPDHRDEREVIVAWPGEQKSNRPRSEVRFDADAELSHPSAAPPGDPRAPICRIAPVLEQSRASGRSTLRRLETTSKETRQATLHQVKFETLDPRAEAGSMSDRASTAAAARWSRKTFESVKNNSTKSSQLFGGRQSEVLERRRHLKPASKSSPPAAKNRAA